MNISKIRVIFEYGSKQFRCVTNAVETAHNINSTFGDETDIERTVRFQLKRFLNRNFYLKNKPPERPPTQANNAELKEILIRSKLDDLNQWYSLETHVEI